MKHITYLTEKEITESFQEDVWKIRLKTKEIRKIIKIDSFLTASFNSVISVYCFCNIIITFAIESESDILIMTLSSKPFRTFTNLFIRPVKHLQIESFIS